MTFNSHWLIWDLKRLRSSPTALLSLTWREEHFVKSAPLPRPFGEGRRTIYCPVGCRLPARSLLTPISWVSCPNRKAFNKESGWSIDALIFAGHRNFINSSSSSGCPYSANFGETGWDMKAVILMIMDNLSFVYHYLRLDPLRLSRFTDRKRQMTYSSIVPISFAAISAYACKRLRWCLSFMLCIIFLISNYFLPVRRHRTVLEDM